MKMLAVDDSPTMLEIVTSTLDEAGHSVLDAGYGTEAVKVMASHQVDMIISDLNMVVLSGLKLLHMVREDRIIWRRRSCSSPPSPTRS